MPFPGSSGLILDHDDKWSSTQCDTVYRTECAQELFEIVSNYQTNVSTHEHRGRFKIARHGAWVTAFDLDKMCFPQADVPVTDTVEADEVAEAFFFHFFSTIITVAPSCNNCNNRNDNDDDKSDKVIPLLKADLRFQGETPSHWWEIEIIKMII